MKKPLTTAVLNHLQITPNQPDLSLLEQLITAYTRTVPWESAFRIVKRAATAVIEECPRWPEEFWHDNMTSGGGGTCFESNYAFFALLQTLGYEGYLTINNMAESIGCHTAIVLFLPTEGGRQKWLVDVGIPLHTPIVLDQENVTNGRSSFLDYTITPIGLNRYQIERHPHPNPYIFTLIDEPVADTTYRTATTRDYLPSGYFLDKLIVSKVIDGVLWRFNSEERPLHLESFTYGQKQEHLIAEDVDVATAVGDRFAIPRSIIHKALLTLRKNP